MPIDGGGDPYDEHISENADPQVNMSFVFVSLNATLCPAFLFQNASLASMSPNIGSV